MVADPGVGVDTFSDSVALSADGSTALIAAPSTTVGGNGSAGEVYFFTRSGNSWSEAQAVPDPSGAVGGRFGSPVALSADGSTALIGAYDTTVGGEVYFFTRSGNSWSQSQAVPDPGAGDFGSSVALSADGSTALIGAPNTIVAGTSRAGEIYFFTRSGNSWSQAQAIPDPAGAAGDEFGSSVALSSDGTVALIGANQYGSPNDGGLAYFFSRSGTSWSQAQAVPDPAGVADDAFGWSVALSSDGSVALIGAINTNVSGALCAGEAYVFNRSGASWSQAQAIPDPPAPAPGTLCDQFGFSVTLSPDGSIALIGAPGNSPGEAYLFIRSGNSWSQAQAVPDPVQTGDHYFGWSGALSSDGSVALIGDPMLREVGGEAWFFISSQPPPPPPPPPPPARISLAPITQTQPRGSAATVAATVDDASGNPVPFVAVNFSVTSGPNAGTTADGLTQSDGTALFTYSSSVIGVDTLVASFTDAGATHTSNAVTVAWVQPTVVGFGDSISVGYGLSSAAEWSPKNADRRFENGAGCSVTPRAYPCLLAPALQDDVGASRNYSIQGATSTDVLSIELPRAEREMSAAERQRVNAVTLTVGADDIDFVLCMTAELMATPDPCLSGTINNLELSSQTTADLKKLATNLWTIVGGVATDFPNARVYLTQYYQPFPGRLSQAQEPCGLTLLPAVEALITNLQGLTWSDALLATASYLHGLPDTLALFQERFYRVSTFLLNALNATIAQAPAEAIVSLDSFAGHDMCKKGQSWVFGGRLSVKILGREFRATDLNNEKCPHPSPEPNTEVIKSDSFDVLSHTLASYNFDSNCIPHPTGRGQQEIARSIARVASP